ncbi:MAG: saccharopine dehydrogenase NADP-binding domain-containing protein [Bacteroidetes bacterium]|nr:saccharopine dehydrogenase NADP-binding domain-containing protein [Bacteroidota bacterium]MBL6943035.1 saccharopine dehydrogenase NADP-binding domain-containing protein [Bacteroidales bacterium]
MKKIIVLGAGLVGKPIALDLANESDFEVAVADVSVERLNNISDKRIQKIQADLQNKSKLSSIITAYDFVVNAVPGFMGYECLKNCIEAGKDIVDIAFYPEDVFELSELAEQKNVRVICDMGVAPGMSNLLTGYAASKLDSVQNVDIFVGGLPKIRTQPWEYKAVFSPSDVIEEYTRPARIVRNGKIVTVPPLTKIELLEFDNVGTLEAFNSDGLRSLLFTIKAENMSEKTLRYPGYAKKIQLLSDNGFFNSKKIDVDGKLVSPLELTSKLLFDQWKLLDNEEDITIMRIIIEGLESGKKIRYSFDLHDEFDKNTGIHSMARTTGYTASTAVRLLAEDKYLKKGISVGEMMGRDESVVKFMLDGLAHRSVNYKSKVEYL